MDEALRKMEARLEGLIPKGISDSGRERLEETIENLAGNTVRDHSGGGIGKWGVGLAASLGVLAGAQLLRSPDGEAAVADPVAARVVDVVERAVAGGDAVPVVETMAVSRHVKGRVDEGWAPVEGSTHVYRYWGYDVTDEEELVDGETGYVVTVFSRREDRIPVRMTSL